MSSSVEQPCELLPVELAQFVATEPAAMQVPALADRKPNPPGAVFPLGSFGHSAESGSSACGSCR